MCEIYRVVNNTFQKYSQYQYLYFMKKIMAILLPISTVKCMAYTLTNTYSNTFHTEIWKPYCVRST